MSAVNAVALLAAAGGDYQISRSVRLRSSASAYFNRTPSASNRNTWTWSAWIKRGTLGAAQTIFAAYPSSTVYAYLQFNSSDQIRYASTNSGASLTTTAVYRDPSAWYHIVFVYDDTQATAGNRLKLYVNGVQVTAFGTATYPTLNFGDYINSANVHNLGRFPSGAEYTDGYITEVNFIDGQALTPSSFGETDAVTGVWKPKKYAGTYGTNGFYLNFSDNSAATAAAIGKDYSGNGNNWTPNNISVTAGVTYDSMLDTPTPYADGGNGRGNYCVINPLQNGATLTNGNLNLVGNSGSATGTVGVTSGKWYWEVTATTMGTSSYIGVSDETWFGTGSSWSYSQVWVYLNSGNKGGNGSSVAYAATYTTGNVIGIALDMDAGTLTFYKDNTSQGTAFSTGISGKVMRPFLATASPSNTTLDANFGQRPFAYTPPTGFKALNTQNLPDSTIKAGNAYFNAVTYTGNSGSQTVSNGVFQPDLTWHKTRSAAASHVLFDSARGASSGLNSDSTNAQNTGWTGQSFTSTGFTVSNAFSSESNYNGQSMVAWQWKKGATQGFDIVTWTGDGGASKNISHALGVKPAMMICRDRSAVANWSVYHKDANASPASGRMQLNLTNAFTAASTIWNSTEPTSSVFTVGSGLNGNTTTFIGYLFSEVAGFSKFGSYTGNGSADGPFVYCGFRPRFLLIKSSSNAQNWHLIDTARDTYNLAGQGLDASTSAAEFTPASSGYPIDILSNGFKHRYASEPNISGATYIFAAFAEVPTKYALAR